MEETATRKKETLTIVLAGGKLPAKVLFKISELRAEYTFDIYLSTAQNMRLYNIDGADLAKIRESLSGLGVIFKRPGLFPYPKVCIGKESCNLGLVDSDTLSDRIIERFAGLQNVKPKFKIAISACPAACSGALLTDIGIVATRKGYDLYVGGKGGPRPKVGRRVLKGVDEENVLKAVGEIIEYHQLKPVKKIRMFKLIDDPDFPYSEEV